MKITLLALLSLVSFVSCCLTVPRGTASYHPADGSRKPDLWETHIWLWVILCPGGLVVSVVSALAAIISLYWAKL